MAFDILIRALLQDQGAGSGLDELNARLRRMEFVGGPGARRGLRLVEQGMRGLALQAVGLRGPIGQITEAFLQLGGGKGAALLAAAGVGAVAVAYRLATADARQLAKANETLVKSYDQVLIGSRGAARGLLEARDATVEAQRQLASIQERRRMAPLVGLLEGGTEEQARQNLLRAQRNQREVRDQLIHDRQRQMDDAELERRPQFARRFVESIEGLAARDRLAILQRERAGMQRLGDEAGRIWAEAYMRAVEESIETGPTLRESLGFTRGLRGRGAPQIGVGPFGLGTGGAPGFRDIGFRQSIDTSLADFDATQDARRREFGADVLGRLTTPLEKFQQQLRLLDAAIAAGQFPAERRAEAERLLRDEMNKTSDAAPRLAAALVGIIGGASIALRGGGIGPLLGAAGSAVSSGIPGLLKAAPGIGSALTIFGGLFSVLGGRRQSVRIEEYSDHALAQQRRTEGPERVVIQIISPTTGELLDEIQYEQGRRQRLDRVVRLPAGASLRRGG